jgi:apolipoprotein N-acyltransferase
LLGFAKLTQGRLDFSPGPGPRTLELPGLPPVGPLICYEVIFPGQVTEPGRRPAWLLNVTNDAWFGTSSGPYQHFASVRLRAVEEGLPAVRAANTGISAVVDSYGRVLHRLGLNRVGTIDSPLPRPADARTLYSRVGNWMVLILIAIFAAAAFVLRLFYNS